MNKEEFVINYLIKKANKKKNPKRIKRICQLLEKVWSTYPDERLGQFLINHVRSYDLFYLDDSVLETKLKTLLKEIKK
jgi:hypothetical protein